jgi:hypothetical protein
MRSVGLGLAFLAGIQFVVVTTPAFAQDPAPAPDKSPAAAPAAAPAPAAGASDKAAAPADSAPATDKAAAPATTAPAANAVASGMVTVHINSPKPVSLEKRSGSTSPWQHVCNSPCDSATPTSDEYQIVGTNLNDSKPFILDSSEGDKITLDVTPGVHAKENAGKWILGGGIVFIAGGVITLAAGSKNTPPGGNDGVVTNHSNMDAISVGTALILVGIIGGLGGTSLLVDNAHTKVEGAVGAVPDKKTDPSLKASVQVTASREPTWHEDRGPAMSPSSFMPILHGTF